MNKKNIYYVLSVPQDKFGSYRSFELLKDKLEDYLVQ